MNGFSILFLLFFLFNIGMECGITIIYNITTTSDGAYRNYFPLLEINPLVASHALSRFNAMHFKEWLFWVHSQLISSRFSPNKEHVWLNLIFFFWKLCICSHTCNHVELRQRWFQRTSWKNTHVKIFHSFFCSHVDIAGHASWSGFSCVRKNAKNSFNGYYVDIHPSWRYVYLSS